MFHEWRISASPSTEFIVTFIYPPNRYCGKFFYIGICFEFKLCNELFYCFDCKQTLCSIVS